MFRITLPNGTVVEAFDDAALASPGLAAALGGVAPAAPAAPVAQDPVPVAPKAPRKPRKPRQPRQPKAAAPKATKAPKVQAPKGQDLLKEIRSMAKTDPKGAAAMAAEAGWVQEHDAILRRASATPKASKASRKAAGKPGPIDEHGDAVMAAKPLADAAPAQDAPKVQDPMVTLREMADAAREMADKAAVKVAKAPAPKERLDPEVRAVDVAIATDADLNQGAWIASTDRILRSRGESRLVALWEQDEALTSAFGRVSEADEFLRSTGDTEGAKVTASVLTVLGTQMARVEAAMERATA